MPHASLPARSRCLFASHGAGAAAHHHHLLSSKSCREQDMTSLPSQPGRHSSMPRQMIAQHDCSYPTLDMCLREGCRRTERAGARETPTGELPVSERHLSCKGRFEEPCKGTTKEVSPPSFSFQGVTGRRSSGQASARRVWGCCRPRASRESQICPCTGRKTTAHALQTRERETGQAAGAGVMWEVPPGHQIPPGLLAWPSALGPGYHMCSAPSLPGKRRCPPTPPSKPCQGSHWLQGAGTLPRGCVTILWFSKTKSLFSRKADTRLQPRAALFQQRAPHFCLELQAAAACLGCRQTRLIIFLGK
ncbi:uncharacterized protein LOC119155098 [Falco rusticolus]|uniref:uncharacterized protein LOC119155098 n=1 Tax=Falco rusticolus TaxID=120794 RepID=UPI00188658E7|nr:uncharacterized protein LOC119155098 [Falco rusticolus]